MADISECFHVVMIARTIFRVDKDTRREIEAWLRGNPARTDSITVESLAGEEVTVLADAVNALWDSTPESRAADRAYQKMFTDEVPIEERAE